MTAPVRSHRIVSEQKLGVGVECRSKRTWTEAMKIWWLLI